MEAELDEFTLIVLSRSVTQSEASEAEPQFEAIQVPFWFSTVKFEDVICGNDAVFVWLLALRVEDTELRMLVRNLRGVEVVVIVSETEVSFAALVFSTFEEGGKS